MTQSNEPNDYERTLDRRYRNLNRRVERLEDTQISAQEFTRSFDRVYEEIESLRREVQTVKTDLGEVNRKIDIILLHVTGQGDR